MALLSNRAVRFSFHRALTASPSLVLLSSLSTVIYFLSLQRCVSYAVCYRKIKKVFVFFLSVREPAVTVHLTGFFHTPKLLQPQLQNPENCKQAIQGLEFHTSLNSLLYHIIAFNWFSVVFNVTSGMSWKDVVIT